MQTDGDFAAAADRQTVSLSLFSDFVTPVHKALDPFDLVRLGSPQVAHGRRPAGRSKKNEIWGHHVAI